MMKRARNLFFCAGNGCKNPKSKDTDKNENDGVYVDNISSSFKRRVVKSKYDPNMGGIVCKYYLIPLVRIENCFVMCEGNFEVFRCYYFFVKILFSHES